MDTMNNRLLVYVRMLTVSSDTEEYALIVMNLIKLADIKNEKGIKKLLELLDEFQ